MSFITMTAKDLAARLNGREYLNEITPDEELEAERNRLVAVFGYSDDCVEFAGYIDDEVGALEGRTMYIDREEETVQENPANNAIAAVWCGEGEEAAWTCRTEIPHETFNIYEDGELFCVGIVFSMDDLI